MRKKLTIRQTQFYMKLRKCASVHHGIPDLIALREQILMCASLWRKDPVRRQHVLGSVRCPFGRNKKLDPRFDRSAYDWNLDVRGEGIRKAYRDDNGIYTSENRNECRMGGEV